MSIVHLCLVAITVPCLVLSAWASALAGAPVDATSFDPKTVFIKAAPVNVPVGTVIAWPAASDPLDAGNWLECDGRAVDRTKYPRLHVLVGDQTPDYRGMFLRGYRDPQAGGSGDHATAGLGLVQGDAIRNITGDLGEVPGIAVIGSGAFHVEDVAGTSSPGYGASGQTRVRVRFDASKTVPTAGETRPVNVAVRYLIRALP
ncbi:MAG: phage tail protein [Desulfovibrio sp.]|jgi:hypothetical protein|nr:phage tail protein [Desulfovibrio sp.]